MPVPWGQGLSQGEGLGSVTDSLGLLTSLLVSVSLGSMGQHLLPWAICGED